MDKYKKYQGVILFFVAVAIMIYVAVQMIIPQYTEWTELRSNVEQMTQNLEGKRQAKANIEGKFIHRLRETLVMILCFLLCIAI